MCAKAHARTRVCMRACVRERAAKNYLLLHLLCIGPSWSFCPVIVSRAPGFGEIAEVVKGDQGAEAESEDDGQYVVGIGVGALRTP